MKISISTHCNHLQFVSAQSFIGICVIFFFSLNLSANEIVSESFDYDPGPQNPFYIDGTGWDQTSPVWNVWAGENLEPDVIAEGSLKYTDGDGNVFPAYGNRLENRTESSILARRSFDAWLGALEGAAVTDTWGDEADERSVPGFGKAGGEVWFSFIVKADGRFEIRLDSGVYNQESAGVSFVYAPESDTMSVGQIWWTQTGHEEVIRAAVQGYSLGEASLVVARMNFGPEWGSDGEGKILNTRIVESGPTRGEPTGRLTVWVNPSIKSVPTDSTAAVECQLVEFRFNRAYLSLSPGVAVDELRLGPSFESLVQKP